MYRIPVLIITATCFGVCYVFMMKMVDHDIVASSDEQFAKQTSKRNAPTPKTDRRNGTTFVEITGCCLQKPWQFVFREQDLGVNCPLSNRKILVKVVLH